MNNIKKSHLMIIIINTLLIFGYINFSIISKEQTLKNGALVLLKLAPVDPRSLMQGDYMIINYAFTRRVPTTQKKGYLIFSVNDNNIASYQKQQSHFEPSENNKISIKYKMHNRDVFIGSDTFFFEEGSAKKYENAQYGGLRVDDKGQALLVNLYDKDLKLLQ